MPGNDLPAQQGIERLNVGVEWETPDSPDRVTKLSVVGPPAEEIATLFLGLEEAYRVMAIALDFPPHHVKVTAVTNPELKIALEGAKEAIEALTELIRALPRLIANLFRPRAAWGLSTLDLEVQQQELLAKLAVAKTAATEAEVKYLQAEIEASRLRQQNAAIPVVVIPAAHKVLTDVSAAMRASAPSRRIAYLAATAQYIATA